MAEEKKDAGRLTEQDMRLGRYISGRTAGAAAEAACPPLEDIAAFIDHRLDGREREALVRHLADCRECRAVLSASLRSQRELGRGSAPRILRTLAYGIPAAVAAGLLLFVGLWYLAAPPVPGPVIVRQGGGQGPARTLAADLASTLLKSGDARMLAVNIDAGRKRALGYGEQASVSRAVFRTGGRLLDLELGLRAGDRERSRAVLASLLDDLKPLGNAGGAERFFHQTLASLTRGGSLSPQASAEGYALLRDFAAGKGLERQLELGAWVEALELAVEDRRNSAMTVADVLKNGNRARNFASDMKSANVAPRAIAALERLATVSEKEQLTPKDLGEVRLLANVLTEEMG